ncbi:hypothetical protein [Vibrio owensii]|uniref:hypothetical protein n=1 Tax=Vibrio owensii TaxID=696485 RepID=UPI004068E51F
MLLAEIGFLMCMSNYRVLSGSAAGSDTAFEVGAMLAASKLQLPLREVFNSFLPWPTFNYRQTSRESAYLCLDNPRSHIIASKFHPNYDQLKRGPKSMMRRNTHQILDVDLEHPVDRIICYTKDGVYNGNKTTNFTGGTGQSIRLAEAYDIPVINIGNKAHLSYMLEKVDVARKRLYDQTGFDSKSIIEHHYNACTLSTNVEQDVMSLIHNNRMDIIVLGLNCQHNMQTGLARVLSDKYPSISMADKTTPRGRSKLGTYSMAEITTSSNHKIRVINAYTEEKYGRDKSVLYSDYEAIRKVVSKISLDFPSGRIAMPMIGSGLANGCPISIRNIIQGELSGREILTLKS